MRATGLIVISSCMIAVAAYWLVDPSNFSMFLKNDSPQLIQQQADVLEPVESGRGFDSQNPHDEFDLDDVLNDLMSMSEDERARAIDQIAEGWAQGNPESLLEQATRLPEDFRRLVRAAVALEWARLDAAAFLDYAEAAALVDDLEPALRVLLESDADRVVMISRRLTPDQDDAVAYRGVPFPRLLMDAIDWLVDENATDAWELMRSLPEGRERTRLMRITGAAYAKKDPDAAFRWLDAALASGDERRTVMSSVELDMIAAVSIVDLDRSIELMLARSGDDATMMGFVSGDVARELAQQDPALARATAIRLFLQQEQGNETDGLEVLKSRFLPEWVGYDAQAAVEWVLENVGHIEPDLAETFVNRLAETDLETAVALLDRVPMEWRNLWIAETAGVYAGQDAAAAIDWLARFSGLPDYERFMEGIMPQIASTDPATAARWIDTAGAAVQPETTRDIARAWAATEPASAGQWVAQFGDQQAHVSAITAVAAAWAREEPDATVQWVMDLPDPVVRDRALRVVALQGSREGNPDVVALLPLFHSNEVQQEILRTVISGNPDRADELLGFVTDPEFRAWVLEMQAAERTTIHTIP